MITTRPIGKRIKALIRALSQTVLGGEDVSLPCTRWRFGPRSKALFYGLLFAVGLLLFPQSAEGDHVRDCIDEPTGEPIEYGDVVRCMISPPGDSDLFRFSGTVGDVAIIQVTGGGGSFGPRPCFRLFDPDFIIVVPLRCVDGTIVRGEFNVTKTGTYTIEVSENGNDQLMNYELNLQRTVPTTPISFGDSRNGQIRHVGDIHFYNFGANPAENDRVTIRVVGGGGSFGPRPCFRLVGPNGNPTREVCSDDTVAQFDFADQNRLTDPGIYEIWVYENGFDQTIDYSLTLICIGPCPPLPMTDLSVTKADSPDPVRVGDELTYTVAVTNNGPAPATGVTLTDTLPGSVTFVSATPTLGTCGESSGTVTCDLGTLANGETATVTIVVTPTVAGEITNTATVRATEGDPDNTNNTATVTTIVTPTITVTLTGCNPCREGDLFAAQIAVNNTLSRTLELKLGYLLPNGSMSSIGDPHREVPPESSFVEEFTENIPPGRPLGTWWICGRLLGLQLGESLMLSCQNFDVVSP